MTSVIEINNDDVFESFDKVLENNKLFVMSEQLNEINVYLFYCENDEIFNYKKYEVNISSNKLSKKELLALILNNNKYYNKKYDLIGIYKYAFTAQPEELKNFCNNPLDANFMTSYGKVQDIEFEHSIESFQSNSSVILIFNKQVKAKKESQNQVKTHAKNKTQKQVRFDIEPRNKTIKKRA